MKFIPQEIIQHSMTYEQYWNLIHTLIAQNKTTGDNHSEDMLHYTKLNMQRSKRIDETISLTDELLSVARSITEPIVLLVITEWWCGDASQIVPIFPKLEQISSKIKVRFILRDEHPEIMNQFLTNGGKAIPIVIVLREQDCQVITHWGPRPKPAQEMVMAYKANPTLPYQEFVKELQQWYNHDKTKTLQQEWVEILRAVNN
ncbi:MAG: thioredoxin family protein [Bacteroidia bacterium]|nr:thioredoxin family protein [Bacteroidia bacterium]